MQKILLTLAIACCAYTSSSAQDTTHRYEWPGAVYALQPVLVQYNQRLQLWDSTQKINIEQLLTTYIVSKVDTAIKVYNGASVVKSLTGEQVRSLPVNKHFPGMEMSSEDTFTKVKTLVDVHVGAYNFNLQKPAQGGGAITTISGDDIKDMAATDVASLIGGRAAGVEVIGGGGPIGSGAQITIRGASSMFKVEPLYIIDGVEQPHGGGALEAGANINPHDIASIEVLKDAGAAAIYGADAAGGVIIITMKMGKGYTPASYSKTVLSEQDDVDYMEDIEATDKDQKYNEYLSLEPKYKTKLNFYLDMAEHFYGDSLFLYVDSMLIKATALCYDTLAGQTAVAYVYEYMKQYDKAAEVYKRLLGYYPGNLKLVRDLAWTAYENKQYDSAVHLLYKAITDPTFIADEQTVKLKDIMLADMNMIIAQHKKDIDLSSIPEGLVKPITADMRIIMESNNYGLAGLSVKEKGSTRLDRENPIGKDNARLENAGYDFSLNEFEVQHIGSKPYTIAVPYFNKGWHPLVPSLVRVVKIKNFGKPDQEIDTDIVSLDNQYGQIELEKFLAEK